MRYITARNTYVRINRHLHALCQGQKLRKIRSRSAKGVARFYLENPDGSIVENVNLERLARRLGCMKVCERVGVPSKRTREEADVLIDDLAKEITSSREAQKAIARDVSEFASLASRFEG
jgi:hypothetical protein